MSQKVQHRVKSVPLSKILSALGDPARLKMIRALLEEDELSCGDFDVTVCKSTKSHHFKVLIEAGIIQRRKEGTRQIASVCAKELENRCPGLLRAIIKATEPL